MNNGLWIDHLLAWKNFLSEIINITEDEGEKIKCERQIKTIERVRYGAVLNPRLISEFISPLDDASTNNICKNYYLELNESQKKAVNTALGETELSLIQGPPGTGKTQVIAEICLQMVKKNPGIRILVCSETHVAVNNLLARISNSNKDIRMVRLRDKENDCEVGDFSPDKIINLYLKWAVKSIENKDAYKIIEEELLEALKENTKFNNQLEKTLALSANVVGMTCNRSAAYNFRDTTEMFDVAIIDEVCKATLPEILCPMIISKKAILIGDPKQLPPVFCSEEQEIIKSIQNCNLDRFMYIDALFKKRKNVCVLNTQYRMSNQIGSMISELFYGGNIINGRGENIEDSLIWISYNPSNQWPIYQQNEEKPKIYNNDECDIISNLLNNIINDSKPNTTVAVIAPYRAQVNSLRKRCEKADQIKIDTVDGFQGKECDIVIFSVTRTTGSYRFLADDRRLNVALSRAKDKIYIVGDKSYAAKEPLLNNILSRCRVEEYNSKE